MNFGVLACPQPLNIPTSEFPWRAALRLTPSLICTTTYSTASFTHTAPQHSVHLLKSTSSHPTILSSSTISCMVSLSAQCLTLKKPIFSQITPHAPSTPNSLKITSPPRFPVAACPAHSPAKKQSASSAGHFYHRLLSLTSSPSSLARRISFGSVATSRRAVGCRSQRILIYRRSSSQCVLTRRRVSHTW